MAVVGVGGRGGPIVGGEVQVVLGGVFAVRCDEHPRRVGGGGGSCRGTSGLGLHWRRCVAVLDLLNPIYIRVNVRGRRSYSDSTWKPVYV